MIVSSPSRLREELAGFTGSDTFRRWSPLFQRHVLTQGAHHLAERAGCYWLMDVIASHQHDPKVRAEGFQVWTLAPDGKGWAVHATDGDKGDGPKVIARQAIEYSTFPLPEGITLWATRNELGGVTIMLPSEY